MKVGDKIIVKSIHNHFGGQDMPMETNAKGRVEKISGNAVKVFFHGHNISQWWHRWQCRRLIRVKKCEECKGSGEAYNGEVFIDETICAICNGKGKVKA